MRDGFSAVSGNDKDDAIDGWIKRLIIFAAILSFNFIADPNLFKQPKILIITLVVGSLMFSPELIKIVRHVICMVHNNKN